MRFFIPLLTYVLLSVFSGFNPWSSAAIAVWSYFLVSFLISLNHSIAFREYILMMYGLNYLFSAAITYEITQEFTLYKMKLSAEEYFSLTIPAMLCLYAGLYSIKTKIFTYRFNVNSVQQVLNEKLLKQWLIAGVVLTFTSSFFPGELSFVAYLLSGIKYIGAFGLFMLDRHKHKWYLAGIFFIEVVHALSKGMFHDLVVWILFFGMVWTYLRKPGAALKTVLIVAGIIGLFILQTVKGTYREQLGAGEAGGFESFSSAVSKNSKGEGFFEISNVAIALSRANQGWIFASSVNKMNRTRNFQQLTLVKLYAEAALLPRFLAPKKIGAADRAIFNKFSGYFVNANTSMALGLFADGYIGYGYWGTLVFAFLFGLLCAGVFKVIEKWAAISPFFVLLCFIILNYAVRADCETQTWMGHIVKGLMVYAVLMYFTKQYFKKNTQLPVNDETREFETPKPQLVPNTF